MNIIEITKDEQFVKWAGLVLMATLSDKQLYSLYNKYKRNCESVNYTQ